MRLGIHSSHSMWKYFEGDMDDVIIYDSKLSASQVSELYSSGSVNGVSPYASYNFEQTSGTLTDQSGNGYDGNNSGATHSATGATITASTPFSNTIIEATGLADNTSEAKNYVFTRDGNDWEIYQNGVSQATATDTTSLGSSVSTGNKLAENTDYCCGNVMNNANQQSVGMKIEAGHVLVGKEINKVAFWLNNHNNPNGDLYARVYDSDQSTVLYTFGSMGASTVGGQAFYNFENTSTDYTVQEDDYIMLDLVGNSVSSGIDPRLDIRYCGDNYGGCPADIAQNISQYEVVGGSWSKSVSPAGSGDELPVFEVYGNESVLYTTNISGMVDEFFINSDALTSSEVEMAYDKGSEPTQIDTTGSTTTDYDDSNITGGNTYYYTVKATNAVGDSNFLTPFVSALAGTPPDVPTSVSSTINSPNTNPLDITVSWSAPTNVGTGTLSGFEIYRDGTLITTTGLVTTYLDTVPSGGGTFEYKLKAVSTHGTSGFSSTTSTTTPTVPATPAAPCAPSAPCLPCAP